jgi:hypothetical protein
MITITKISAMAFICALSMQGHAVTLEYDEYGAKWSAVDALQDTEFDQLLHEIKMDDTLPDASNFFNQALANGLSGVLRDSNTAFNGDVFKEIGDTDAADKMCDDAERHLTSINTYEQKLKDVCASDTDCNAKYNNGHGINVDDISDEERLRLYREGKIDELTAQDQKEKYQKQLDDNKPKTWEAVKDKIREIVKKDEYLPNKDLMDMMDSGAYLSTRDPISGVTNKDEAFDHYFYSFQKAIDDDPKGFQQKLSNLEGYNKNLSNLDMNNDTHRDYLAAVAATIASEHQTFASGLDSEKTTD